MAKAKHKQPENACQCCNEAIEPYNSRLIHASGVYNVVAAYNKLLTGAIYQHSLGKYAIILLLSFYYVNKPTTIAAIDEKVSYRRKVKGNAYESLNKLIDLGYVIPTTGRKSKWGGMGYRYSLTISGRLFVEKNLVKPLIAAIA